MRSNRRFNPNPSYGRFARAVFDDGVGGERNALWARIDEDRPRRNRAWTRKLRGASIDITKARSSQRGDAEVLFPENHFRATAIDQVFAVAHTTTRRTNGRGRRRRRGPSRADCNAVSKEAPPTFRWCSNTGVGRSTGRSLTWVARRRNPKDRSDSTAAARRSARRTRTRSLPNSDTPPSLAHRSVATKGRACCAIDARGHVLAANRGQPTHG